MKSFIKEFKEFITKGNVISMAVGIIIGGAFTAIVNSVVEQIISPLLGVICGGIDFSAVCITVGNASFGVGIVINAIITFLLTALVLFLIVKAANKASEAASGLVKKDEEAEKEPEPEPEPSDEAKLLKELIEVIKNQQASK